MKLGLAPKGHVVRRLGVAAVAVGMMATLAACGGSDSSSSSDGATEIKIGSIYSPVNLDPAQASGIGQTQQYLTPVYDQLTQLNEKGEVVPMLAESWEFAPDGKSLTLKLRTDVTFSDGEAFNAEAVKANLERYKTEAIPPVQSLIKNLDSVEVVDEFTVKVNLVAGGGAELPDSFAASPGYMISPAALGNADLDVNPVGSGAYEVKKGSFRSGQSVGYVKRDGDYWGGTDVNQIDELELFGYANAEAGLNALQSGEIDMLASQVSERVAEFQSNADYNVNLTPTRGYYQIRMNMENPALADLRTRQAIAHAVDRQAFGEVATGTTDGCMPSAQPLSGIGKVEGLDDAYPFDVAKAKALLAEAGNPTLKLKGLSVENNVAQVIQGQLKAVGIDVEFTTVTPEQYIEQWGTKKYDITPGSTTLRYPGDILYRFVDEPSIIGEVPAEVTKAAEGMYDPTKSDDERIAQWQEVGKVAVETVSANTILCHTNLAVVAKKDVEGIDKIPGVFRGSYDVKNLSIAK